MRFDLAAIESWILSKANKNTSDQIDTRPHEAGRVEPAGGRFRPVVLPPVKTFCLADIQNVEGIVLADHLWLNWRQTFSTLGELQEGQVVEFVATVTEYEKRRYRGNRKQVAHSGNGGTDYRLSYPANVRVIK